MSTTEYAAEIRKALKAKGWSTRDVSVRAKYFSMGSSIDVTIKNSSVPLPVVKEIAERAESISRCQITGEILSGGNRYVSVSYSHEAQETIANEYIPAVKAAVDAVAPGSNSLEPVGTTGFLVGRPNEWRITLWEDRKDHGGCIGENNSVEGIAYTIGSRIVARGGR